MASRNNLAEAQSEAVEEKFEWEGNNKHPWTDRSKKSKSKRLKSDPKRKKTKSQIKAEPAAKKNGKEEPMVEEEGNKFTKVKEKKRRKKKSKKKSKEVMEVKAEVQAEVHVENMETLREKLRQRIAELKAKRCTIEEAQEQKRLRRKEGKLRSKIKHKKDKHKPLKSVQGTNGHVIASPRGGAAKPVVNKDGKMVFSKFDLTDTGGKEKPSNSLTGKDYKRLLEKVEKRKQKIQELSEKDAEKGKKFQEKVAWETALHKAEGVKVKDNPEHLKKALKRKEKVKEHKKKKWEERVERTEKQKKDRQDKRRKNISAKKQSRIHGKINKQKKKGRVIPGF